MFYVAAVCSLSVSPCSLLCFFLCLFLLFLGSVPSNGCVFQDCVGHHHKEEYIRASGGAQAANGAAGD